MVQNKKIFVGLSGGVDSSVSAYLLKKQGFDVVGVFVKVWQPEFLSCTWKEERLDAMRVAKQLNIPFMTMDLSKEYKEGVADYMIEEYKKGRTPNPDVMCNKAIKFGFFLQKALKMGADFVATGHYARTKRNDNKIQLLKGVDKEKDQSYFLWTLTQKQLRHVLFPVGDLEKKEVREVARKAGLLTAEKKDSQGLCFVGKLNMKDFLAHFLPKEGGVVLNTKGEKIGVHDGAWFLTNGQRHGFTITKKTPDDKPFYIIARDIKKNTITVSEKKEERLEKMSIEAKISKLNIITGRKLKENYKYDTRVRYRQKLFKSVLHQDGLSAVVKFDEPQTIASGQSIVFYDGDICIGGGIIK